VVWVLIKRRKANYVNTIIILRNTREMSNIMIALRWYDISAESDLKYKNTHCDYSNDKALLSYNVFFLFMLSRRILKTLARMKFY